MSPVAAKATQTPSKRQQQFIPQRKQTRRRRPSSVLMGLLPPLQQKSATSGPAEEASSSSSSGGGFQVDGSDAQAPAREPQRSGDESIIMTVDLSAIPIVEAPPIDDGDDTDDGDVASTVIQQVQVGEDVDVTNLLESMQKDVALQLRDEPIADVVTESTVQLDNTDKSALSAGLKMHESPGPIVTAAEDAGAEFKLDDARDLVLGLTPREDLKQPNDVLAGSSKLQHLSYQIADLVNGIESARSQLDDLDESNASIIRAVSSVLCLRMLTIDCLLPASNHSFSPL